MEFYLLLKYYYLLLLAGKSLSIPYIDDEEDYALQNVDTDYTDNGLENLLRAGQQKRACIKRGGNCDHRPKDCCHSSSCRCNLWGSNCRCQRAGFFQKWG
ncbi:xibalbin-1 isoform X2 [Augochlora pura]